MLRLLNYYGRFERARGHWDGLPSWARGLILIAALPGLLLALLSIVAFAISVGVLLLLSVPVYRLATAINGSGWSAKGAVRRPGGMGEIPQVDIPPAVSPPSGRRHIEVTIIE